MHTDRIELLAEWQRRQAFREPGCWYQTNYPHVWLSNESAWPRENS
jgi:hypothetical protein